MNRNFQTMKQDVGENIQDTSANTSNIIGRYINDAYFDILRRVNWENINHTFCLKTQAGVRDYILPSNFGKEVYVRNVKDECQLTGISTRKMADDFPSTLGKSGAVSHYSILNMNADADPNSSTDVLELAGGDAINLAGGGFINLASDGEDASALSIVSTSTSDLTPSVYVRGFSNGVEQSEKVVLTGTTPVETVNEYTGIITLSKEATVGIVTITAHAGSLQVAKMAPDTVDYRVKCLRLQGVPDKEFVIECPYTIDPQPLLKDNDTPLINIADVIEDGATARAWRYKRQFAKAREYERIYEKGITNLIWNRANQPNQVPLFNPQPQSRNIW